ncbi:MULTISPECIES: hypothetical protein [unclassified Pseudofrankia]|uniref:hypothetical protein n=1 Tax=unclassified Pseudofrankia TaxID=2994372 RepID=UPI0008D9F048|nr:MULTISPECIES: hypothetical protein [unclassified Pseudofrankia]MDT3442555.1 hypothetical protein [Pseudofrankia sp. BMG5.37]OHV71786.1 hypothetical protein BCD48_34375 [Pseudofrankia sp. BMG5.36]
MAAAVQRHRAPDRPRLFELFGRTWDLLAEVYAPVYASSTRLFTQWISYPVGGSLLEVEPLRHKIRSNRAVLVDRAAPRPSSAAAHRRRPCLTATGDGQARGLGAHGSFFDQMAKSCVVPVEPGEVERVEWPVS